MDWARWLRDGLARTTLQADPACWCRAAIPSGRRSWVPLFRPARPAVLLPSLVARDPFSPPCGMPAPGGLLLNAISAPASYQAYYLVQEQLCTCLTWREPGHGRSWTGCVTLLEDRRPSAFPDGAGGGTLANSAYLDLLRGH